MKTITSFEVDAFRFLPNAFMEGLLWYLSATSLILCGRATNRYVVCSAHDANMRDFELIVPSDCSHQGLKPNIRSDSAHDSARQEHDESNDSAFMVSTRLDRWLGPSYRASSDLSRL